MCQSDPHEPVSGTDKLEGGLTQPVRLKSRWVKAPPVDPFMGEEMEIRLDDWVPSLERAATWNEWTEGELLLQFAGHLWVCALQEWSLLDEASKETYQTTVESLCWHIDFGGPYSGCSRLPAYHAGRKGVCGRLQASPRA